MRCVVHTLPLAGLIILLVVNSSKADVPLRTGLVLWLDATDVDGDGNSRDAAQSMSKVARWVDKSGFRNHVEQEDQARQPTVAQGLLRGQPVLRFDGDDVLARDKFAGFTYRDQPMHVITVLQSLDGSSRPMPRVIEFQPVEGDLANPASVKQHGLWIGPQRDGRMRIGTHYGDEGSALSIAWDAKPHVVEVVYAGAQRWVHYLDGARDGGGLLGDRDFHGFTKDLRLAIGQHYGSTDPDTFFEGQLAEVLIYDRVLSADEQNVLKDYLGKKWSLDLSIQSIPHFERDVLPILTQRCHECHGADVQEADVDLRTVTAMLRRGTGGPVISRGHPEFSELLEQILSGAMPPDGVQPLDEVQIAIIRRWIEAGAPADENVQPQRGGSLISDEDRAFWAFQKLARREPPNVINVDRVRTPIDAFVLARLEPHGLSLAPEADRITMLRRAYFDLLGLPPSPKEIEEALADETAEAYERMIDGLLESEHFGERWGRSWLDWAGYVDVYGKDNDFAIIKPLEGRWRYRDYVVRSFNNDKPFNRFLIEQLAGDELIDWRNAERFTPEMVELLTATGFLLCSDDDTDQNELNTPNVRHHVLQQTGEIVANNLFALTIQCSRCHDHKYEAIPQLDYYAWLANFSPIFNPQRWVTSVEHGIPDVSAKERPAIDRRNAEIDAEVVELVEQRDAAHERNRQRLCADRLAKLHDPIRADVKAAFETPAHQRDEVQEYLVAKMKGQVEVTLAEAQAALSDEARAAIEGIDARIESLRSQKRDYATIQVAVEQNPPSPMNLLRRGDVTKPGVEVPPASLSILTASLPRARQVEDLNHDADAALQRRGATSGRRLAIANQVADAESIAGALVARVFVNRVWQELFGKGIVETSDNFGVSGSRPTHPQLLEWLAAEFADNGWKVKPLIKRMMMSNVYRQSSTCLDAEAEQADPANSLLWRARLRRLPSEYIRDRVLAASGQLDRSVGGKPVPLLARPDGKIVIKMDALPTPTSHLRRSLYILNRRNYHLSLLTTFDQPFLTSNCTVRKPSAVVTQSLAMMNDELVVEQANHFAERVVRETNALPEAWVEKAFQIALCRVPREREKRLCLGLIERHTHRYQQADLEQAEAARKALAHLCHTLFNTNEFLYVQ